MAEDNGNRATVAGVDAKVDGLRDLIRAEFKDVQRQLTDLSGLGPRVRDLELEAARRGDLSHDVADLDRRLTDIETKGVTTDQVKTALAFEREQRIQDQAANFSKKEKIIALLIALAMLAATINSQFHIL